jgi:hypothetical protein
MPEVRQSSFALLGDLAKACFKHVKPCIGKRLSHEVFQRQPRAAFPLDKFVRSGWQFYFLGLSFADVIRKGKNDALHEKKPR